ncbi:WXG100 family type VII secretion target [Kitasatospora sp. NBC_00315]|uniref:WXG100 family type VII secretion target n=1 Tax=Kitasatospora sp. NBC_00315 TaxID=2975963 RepID=UPI003244BD2C
MNFISKAWDGATEVVKDVVMAPAEIAHWALNEMFGEGDLHQIAQELAELAKQVDTLSKDINTALGQLTWHGPAADAFVSHAHGRVRELGAVSDHLAELGKSVERLNNVF